MATDFYDLLDVSRDATADELKVAYRQKAREYHPDVNDDERATAQFTTVRKAYKVLSNQKERTVYDRMGHEAYVESRMDLPKGGMGEQTGSRWNTGSSRSRTRRRSSSTDPSDRGSSRSSSSRSSSARSSSSRSSSSRSSSARSSSARSSSSRSSSARSSSSRSSSSRDSGSDASATSSGRSRSRTARRTGPSSTSSASGAKTTDTTRTNGASSAADSTTSAGTSSRSPLWYGWGAVLAAFAVFLAGTAWFALSNLQLLRTLLLGASRSPATALAAPSGLEPAAYARSALLSASVPSLDLLFVVGVVCYPLVFLAVVAKFGRGSAWLYPLGALAPVVAVVAAPFLPPVAALDVAMLAVLPVVVGLAFLVDVGRVLVSTD